MRWMIGWVILLMVAGCQTAAVNEERWFRPVPGTVVELTAALSVPRGAARIFLQHGEPVAWNGLRQREPHCHFEVREVMESPQTIHADRFRVVRVGWGYEQVVRLGPTQVARGPVAQGVDDGSLPAIAHYVRLHLESPTQPGVMRLTCHGAFDDWAEAEEPTPEEIEEALGRWARFI